MARSGEWMSIANTTFLTELEQLGKEACDENVDVEKLLKRVPPALARLRRQAKVRPAPMNGNRIIGLKHGYFECTLRDGTIGYFQRRTDDCMQAAMATLVQMPMPEVPDLGFDKLAEGRTYDEIAEAVSKRYGEWCEKHGVSITYHSELPTTARRWIGVCRGWSGKLHDHCLVMSGDECIWDTTRLLPPAKDEQVLQEDGPFGVEDIYYGITVERTGP